jgi:flagellar protein FlaG
MEINGIDSVKTPLHSKLASPVPTSQVQPSATPLRNTEQAVKAAPPVAGEESPESQGGLEKLRAAVEKIQEFVSSTASDIEFSIDEESGRTIVKVIDRETEDVIRQIPSQEMLDLAKALDRLQGLLIKQKA